MKYHVQGFFWGFKKYAQTQIRHCGTPIFFCISIFLVTFLLVGDRGSSLVARSKWFSCACTWQPWCLERCPQGNTAREGKSCTVSVLYRVRYQAQSLRSKLCHRPPMFSIIHTICVFCQFFALFPIVALWCVSCDNGNQMLISISKFTIYFTIFNHFPPFKPALINQVAWRSATCFLACIIMLLLIIIARNLIILVSQINKYKGNLSFWCHEWPCVNWWMMWTVHRSTSRNSTIQKPNNEKKVPEIPRHAIRICKNHPLKLITRSSAPTADLY